MIDLTHVLREGMIGHPFHGRTPVRLAGSLNHWIYASSDRRNPYDGEKLSFANEQWVLNGNTGTHMDSVWHADPDTVYSAERMPVECGYGTAVWLDCSFVKEPCGRVTPEVLEEAERRSGEVVGAGDIVLVHTGWSDLVAEEPQRYLDEHMGLTKDAGEWLRDRQVRTVGIDNSTVETVDGARESPVHMNFLRPRSLGRSADDFIAIIENLVHIDRIPRHRFHFVGLPLPFEGGSGSPIRALAVVE
jgi:kynurenine formamidase